MKHSLAALWGILLTSFQTFLVAVDPTPLRLAGLVFCSGITLLTIIIFAFWVALPPRGGACRLRIGDFLGIDELSFEEATKSE